jgi:hypothetical protein
MSEQSELTVRQLPDGVARAAREGTWDGSLLAIELTADDHGGEFDAGALVEIESAGMIYLGAVLLRQGLQMSVEVEHAIDRGKLSRIQEMWDQREA